jgi:hypothetical protein
MKKFYPDIRNVGPSDVISGDPVSCEVRAEPVLFHLKHFKSYFFSTIIAKTIKWVTQVLI